VRKLARILSGIIVLIVAYAIVGTAAKLHDDLKK
jgi:hypothetical protein